MLFKNDVFALRGERFRLLHTEPSANRAWVISLEDTKAWPLAMAWDHLNKLEPHGEGRRKSTKARTSESQASPASGDAGDSSGFAPELESESKFASTAIAVAAHTVAQPAVATLVPTDAMRKARDAAMAMLGSLPSQLPAIFDGRVRGYLVRQRAQELGCSRTALFKNLRRYWIGGQTPAALLSMFGRCGRSEKSLTGGRGAKPNFEHDTYQLTEADTRAIHSIIKKVYLKDERVKITHAYQRLLEKHYETIDGNGDAWIRPHGERPSLRQFEYYLRSNFSLEQRLRGRRGDKDFERENRAVLGTVLADCLGVGHYYEADATIADVYLVAAEDSRQIVGKPTIYLIMDRKSRLIVGWYVGLENPSWVCAMQALVSISQDKRELCARYGVAYDPADWPAHQVFPKEVLADRGELFVKASDQLAQELAVTVTNVPAKRGDWKPVVECGFKLTRMVLQDGTPGFDPPENAKKRQGKHYEKDACLTLKQFGAIVLLSIIEHNRRPMRAYELSLKEMAQDVEPTPIGIWNNNIVERAGVLPRYSEERVRQALLPRDEATVTEEGIVFRNCTYSCPAAIADGWFVQARRRHFKVTLSYDGRLVDTVFVHDPNCKDRQHECVLTVRGEKYRGLSFAEVEAIANFRRLLQPEIEQGRLQVRANFHKATAPIIDKAQQRLKDAGPHKTRTARKADIKGARQDDLRKERQEVASPAKPSTNELSANVVSFARAKANAQAAVESVATAINGSAPADSIPTGISPAALPLSAPSTGTSDSSGAQPARPLTLAEKVRLARQRMLHG
jgi:putative transposase